MADEIVADGEAGRNSAAEPPASSNPDFFAPIPLGSVWSVAAAVTADDGLQVETATGWKSVTKPVTIEMRIPCSGGRRATRFVAEFFEQAGHPGLALATASAVAALLNQAALPAAARPPLAVGAMVPATTEDMQGLREIAQAAAPACEWAFDRIEESWCTSCPSEDRWTVYGSVPAEDGYIFCPSCGGRIEAAP